MYRAIDSSGLTLDTWLRKSRDKQATYAFFKRLIKQFGEPRVFMTDKAPSLSSALKRLKSEGSFIDTDHRTRKYLNNIIEQDHRHVKKRHKSYQSIMTAYSTIKGIETIHALYKTSQRDGNLVGVAVSYEINQSLGITV